MSFLKYRSQKKRKPGGRAERYKRILHDVEVLAVGKVFSQSPTHARMNVFSGSHTRMSIEGFSDITSRGKSCFSPYAGRFFYGHNVRTGVSLALRARARGSKIKLLAKSKRYACAREARTGNNQGNKVR